MSISTQNLYQFRLQAGIGGEQYVACSLENQGYQILALNYRVHRVGEIDIIALRDNYIICVEVKTRRISRFMSRKMPMGVLIPPSKQRKLIKTAKYYLSKNGYSENNYHIRFDVALVLMSPESSGDKIEQFILERYIPNAF